MQQRGRRSDLTTKTPRSYVCVKHRFVVSRCSCLRGDTKFRSRCVLFLHGQEYLQIGLGCWRTGVKGEDDPACDAVYRIQSFSEPADRMPVGCAQHTKQGSGMLNNISERHHTRGSIRPDKLQGRRPNKWGRVHW